MTFNKRIWKGRQGTGLNKFSIDGATPVTVINQPDSVTEQGDALSAGNLNDLENRIYTAFEDEETEREDADSNLLSAIDANSKRITNLETKAGDEILVTYPSATYGMDSVPASVAPYAKVRELIMNSRVHNQLAKPRAISSSGLTITVSDGEIDVDGTTTENFSSQICSPGTVLAVNHIGLVGFLEPNVKWWDANHEGSGSALDGLRIKNITSGSDGVAPYYYIPSGTAFSHKKLHFICRDLTVYFNGTIPTNAQTIADIQTNYPELLIPSDYDTGTRVDTTYSAVRAKGANLFNKDDFTLFNGYVSSSGVLAPSTGGEKTFIIKALPSQAYYFIRKESYGRIASFTYNPSSLDTGTVVSTSSETAFTFNSLAETAYLAITFRNSIGNNFTYEEDIEGMYLGYGTSGSFTPWREPSTLTLPSPVTGKSAGSVHQIYYPETGEMTEPLGEYTFTADDAWETFYAPNGLYSIPFPSMQVGSVNAILLGYTFYDSYFAWGDALDKALYKSSDGKLYVKNVACTSLALIKAEMAGKLILYERATPNPNSQATDPMSDPFIKVEGNGTIRPVQSQTTQIDSAMSVDYLGV